jgi:hypothetical protein
MFTSGIRKILTPLNDDVDKDELEKMAVELGFYAYSLKGDIYVRLTKKSWMKTEFRVSDFCC